MPYNYDTLMGECPDEAHAAKFFQNCGLLHADVFAIVVVKCVQAAWLLVMATNYRSGGAQLKIVRQVKVLGRTRGFSHPNFHSTLYWSLFTGGQQSKLLLNFAVVNLIWIILPLSIGKFRSSSIPSSTYITRSMYLREACANWILNNKKR